MNRALRFTLLGLAVVVVVVGCGGETKTVTVTTSEVVSPTGPVSVPFVEGKLERLAVSEVRAEGLVVRVRRLPSDSIEEGRVFDQDPAAGTRVEEGAEVVIDVSTG